MKIIVLIFVVNVVIECKSSCVFDNDTFNMLWTKDHYAILKGPLESFFYYHKIKKELKSTINSKFPQLQCDLKDICRTKDSKREGILKNSKYNYSFCELYFLFEYTLY